MERSFGMVRFLDGGFGCFFVWYSQFSRCFLKWCLVMFSAYN